MKAILITGVLAFAGSAVASFPDCVNGPLANNTVCDRKADPYTRATALVSLFTFDEKVNNSGNASPGVPRIGLPAYQWWSEALHGVAGSPGVHFTGSGDYSYATSFPQPITMGAAFDDELIHSVATVISTEARAFSNGNNSGLNYWTPNINPYRDPRWGRGQETPGEDPFHLSSYVNQLIIGLQGGLDLQPYKKIVATCKHYAGYDIEDWQGHERYGFDAVISSQDLREYYLPPFQKCARDSNAQSIMCSYNAVNGVPTCADPYLLQTILREKWGWTDEDQWVTSDCDAVKNIYNAHNFTKTPEEAVAAALNAGTDLDCGTFSPLHLGAAYTQSLYNISTLDRSLIRRYASLVRLGYFDPASLQPYRQISFADVSTSSSQDLALQAAEEGIVLLKNDGSLPLKTNITKVAVIGPLGNSTFQMQGNYQGRAPYLHSPCNAALRVWNATTCTQGVALNNASSTGGILGAVAAARAADAIIFVGGIDNSIESESRDRNNITWPGAQLQLISQLANLSKPLIVVQMGDQVDSSSLNSNPGVNGILWAGYPGQDGGTAIINIITGKTAPAGRLPVTQYPAKYVDDVPMTDMNLRPGEGNPGRTYKWYTGKPVFEFGHGLHYTNFTGSISAPPKSTYDISSLISNSPSNFSTFPTNSSTKASFKDLTPFATVPITVSNTGSVTSDYVALGFLTGSFGPEPYPIKSLVAYTRLHDIAAGEKRSGELSLTLGNLGRVNEDGELVLYPGSYSLVLDVDSKATWNFTLTGESKLLDGWPKAPE